MITYDYGLDWCTLVFAVETFFNSDESVNATQRFFHARFMLCDRGVIVIVVGNEHGNTSSNPGPD